MGVFVCWVSNMFLIHLGNGYMEMDSHSTKVMGIYNKAPTLTTILGYKTG